MPRGSSRSVRSYRRAVEVARRLNLAPRWVEWLKVSGIGAIHWSTFGKPGATDAEVMNHAASHGLTVLAHDLDFGKILAASSARKLSVVQIRAEDISPEAVGAQLAAGLRSMEAELNTGTLLTVDPSRSRLRLVPLRAKPER